MRTVGKCKCCGKNGYVNSKSNLCRRCQDKKDRGVND